MKRLTRSEIKAELEKPNGSAEIMNDSTIDKISLCDETTAMFIEENIGSALMIRLAKSRAIDRKSTRLNSSHSGQSRMPSSA